MEDEDVPADDALSEDPNIDEWETPDEDDIGLTKADELFEEMQARRERQREQVSSDWCETIRDAGERYRKHSDADAVADDLQLNTDKVREALTVYRFLFEETPETAAMIASQTGRAFFALSTAVEDVVDLEDRDDAAEDLVREYVGAVYLEYDIDEEPIGDPVERDAPKPPLDYDEIAKTMVDAVAVSTEAIAAVTAMDEITEQLTIPTESLAAAAAVADANKSIAKSLTVPTGAFTVAAAMGDLNETFAKQLTLPAAEIMATTELAQVHEPQLSALAASVQPILEQHDQLMKSVAASTLTSLTDVLTEIKFPESVLADLAAIQPTVNAAAAAATIPSTDIGHTGVSRRSVSPPEPETVDLGEPSVSPEPGTVEPSANSVTGVPLAGTVDATLPAPEMVSTELVFEIPTLVVDCILSTGEVRVWFSELPQDHQNTVVNVILISATLSVTGSLTLAALAPFITPSVRRMIVTDIEEDS